MMVRSSVKMSAGAEAFSGDEAHPARINTATLGINFIRAFTFGESRTESLAKRLPALVIKLCSASPSLAWLCHPVTG